jgi:hypothetical protein
MIKNNYKDEDEDVIELNVPLLIPPTPIIKTINNRMIYRRAKILIKNVFALSFPQKKIYVVR